MECSVCFEDVIDGVQTSCGHTYHRQCIRKWLTSHVTCPLCRCEIANTRPDVEDVIQTYSFIIYEYEDIRVYAPLYSEESDDPGTDIVMVGNGEGGAHILDNDIDDDDDSDVGGEDDSDYVMSESEDSE